MDAERTRWLHRLWSRDEPLLGQAPRSWTSRPTENLTPPSATKGRRLIAGTNDATCAGLSRLSDGRLVVAARDGGEAVVMFIDR